MDRTWKKILMRVSSFLIAAAVMTSMVFADTVVLAEQSHGMVAAGSVETPVDEAQYFESIVQEAFGFDPDMASGPASLVKKLQSVWILKGSNLRNIRAMAKQKTGKFGILQGCCTDGRKFVYLAFNRASDDAVKVVKMQIVVSKLNPAKTTFKYVKSTPVLKGIGHGNDMAYVRNAGGSGRDKILIITSESNKRDGAYIGMIDPNTMKEEGGKVYRYWKDLSEASPVAYPPDTTVKKKKRRTMESLVSDKHGYSTIAYNESKDLIVATVKTDRDILILRPVWKVTGESRTDVELKKLVLQRYIRQNKNNATSQGIDIDNDYIYTAWSPMSGKLSKNILQIYDYEGNHIGDRNVSGYYELEDIFHIGKGSNAKYFGLFYTSGYYDHKYKKTVKVKWKKVTKLVNGEYKKVWKYKKKKRWVTETRFERRAYMMHLGNLTK